MTSATDKKKDETAAAKAADDGTAAPATPAVVVPPLEAAARRLERLLGGGGAAAPPPKTKNVPSEESLIITNPGKIVRRWLGSSSGASSGATLASIASCATKLLDPVSSQGRALLLKLSGPEGDAMETSSEGPAVSILKIAQFEVEAWLLSLAVKCLYQEKKHREAFEVAQQAILLVSGHVEGAAQATAKMNSAGPLVNSPALFPLLSRLYRLRSLVAEHALGSVAASAHYLRQDLVQAHRRACLRRDVDTQATVLNLMLRDLLATHQIEQAQKLVSNATFPTSSETQTPASNNQLCRYLYYSGRIQALRLEYTQSNANLSQCLRKVPTNTALGFRISVQCLVVVVQLLMGEIPERHVFFSSEARMRAALEPYLKIAQAVRRGDLKVFESTVSTYAAQFQADDTFTLISRLSHSVVKAGLRQLNVSYSRIRLEDVAARLSLPSAASAEFVVAKAIRDGVMEATLHHEEQYVQSHEMVDVYANTTEPMEAFHRRIAYCLTTHNEALRGMRYRPDAYKKALEASRGGKKNSASPEDDKTDEEKAQELEDEFEDEF